MTAIRHPDTAAPLHFSLICDECGRSEIKSVPTSGADEWRRLWQRAHSEGWHGRDRAIGPHQCPSCTSAQRSDNPDLPSTPASEDHK